MKECNKCLKIIAVCPDGQYISNRQCVPCPGHCVDGTPCDKLTGRCNDGCSNYWTGEYCESTWILHKPLTNPGFPFFLAFFQHLFPPKRI